MNKKKQSYLLNIFCMFFLSLLCILIFSASGNDALANAAQGKRIFKKCAACHETGEGARKKVGPPLNGLDGRPAASIDGYRYSKAMRQAGADGLIWDRGNLSDYLKEPRAFLKGTNMSFNGLKKDKERQILIDWLLTLDREGHLKEAEEPKLGAAVAALDGDPEYGEYLSGECVVCHRLSGEESGIPSIIGMRKREFIHALFEYKMGIRENPVMRTVTVRLGDEEMAALAAYYGSLNPQ